MKKIFSLAMAIAFLVPALILFAEDQAATPEYQQGDFWQFRLTEKDILIQSTALIGNGDYEVFYSGGQFRPRPLAEKPQAKQNLSVLVDLLNNPKRETQFLQFPLAVGKKWSVDYEVQAGGAGRAMGRHADNEVKGMEEVTTAAGKFRAFKIERYDTGAVAAKGGSGNWVYTYYYSPETKSIVKYHYEVQARAGAAVGGQRDIELIKFGSKKPDFKPQQGQGPG
jgi:hypothetical protein